MEESKLAKKRLIYRISLVWMFYATPPSEKTPKPFAELRVFFFTEMKPSKRDIAIAKKGMRTILEKLFSLFFSLPEALAKDRAEYEEKMVYKTIEGLVTEIRGFEVEGVDLDEVMEYFRRRRKKFKLLENYRYARFYRRDGTIKREYDEWDIRELEKRAEVEEYGIMARRIIQQLGEVMEYIRRLEASRREYERMIRELREM